VPALAPAWRGWPGVSPSTKRWKVVEATFVPDCRVVETVLDTVVPSARACVWRSAAAIYCDVDVSD
jgi:hypothetical protein